MPKVSVLMPVYRTKETYLREAIESILAQTFTDFEFLILDDCPEDDREDVVKSYQDTRIKYSKNEHNLGISESRNKLITMAEGEYLAVFDHDDISLPERFAKQVAYLDAHPEVGVVGGLLKFIPKGKISNHPETNLDIKIGLMNSCVVAHTAVMIRKSVLNKSGVRYEENFTPAEDYRLFLQLVAHTMFYNIQEVMCLYRSTDNNTSNLQKDKMANVDALCRCYAASKYPYLCNKEKFLYGCKHIWLNFFNFIPLFKIKITKTKITIFIFGIIPLFSIKGKK